MKILFLCTGNSCRSQMAHGWANALKPEFEFESAGLEAHGLNPNAAAVMAEAGVDISHHQSQTLDDLQAAGHQLDFDVVFTVCGHADETCPAFPGNTRKIHVGFDDPPKLAASAASEEEAFTHYRRVRDEIREFVTTLESWL